MNNKRVYCGRVVTRDIIYPNVEWMNQQPAAEPMRQPSELQEEVKEVPTVRVELSDPWDDYMDYLEWEAAQMQELGPADTEDIYFYREAIDSDDSQEQRTMPLFGGFI